VLKNLPASFPCVNETLSPIVIGSFAGSGKTIFASVGLGEWEVRDDCRLAHRMLKKAVLFVCGLSGSSGFSG
jgi:hypothetical protein